MKTQPEFARLYGGDPADQFFVKYIPLLLKKTRRYIVLNSKLKKLEDEVRHEALAFAYLYYRELSRRFDNDQKQAHKLYIKTFWFRVFDRLNVKYLRLVMDGKYINKLPQEIYLSEKMQAVLVQSPETEPLEVLIKKERRQKIKQLLREIENFAGTFYDKSAMRILSREQFQQLVSEIFDSYLRQIDAGLGRKVKPILVSKSIADKYPCPATSLYEAYYRFLRHVRKRYGEDFQIIFT